MKIQLRLLVSLFGYHYEMSTDPNQYDTLLCIINLLIAQIIPAISVDNPWGEI